MLNLVPILPKYSAGRTQSGYPNGYGLLLPYPVRIPSPWHSGRAIVATIVLTGAAASSGLDGCQNLITWGI